MKSNTPKQITVFYVILVSWAILIMPSVMMLFKLFGHLHAAFHALD